MKYPDAFVTVIQDLNSGESIVIDPVIQEKARSFVKSKVKDLEIQQELLEILDLHELEEAS